MYLAGWFGRQRIADWSTCRAVGSNVFSVLALAGLASLPLPSCSFFTAELTGIKQIPFVGQQCADSSMLCRWRSILAFVALKLCEAAFVACLVLARTRKTTRFSAGWGLLPSQPSATSLRSPGGLGLPSQSSATSLRSTTTNSVLGAGARTGARPACSRGQRLRALSGVAATYLAALLEVCPVAARRH
jgi:hypothetical protein